MVGVLEEEDASEALELCFLVPELEELRLDLELELETDEEECGF